MANYTETFTAVNGDTTDAAELETEFDAIATAIATKLDAYDGAAADTTLGGSDKLSIYDGAYKHITVANARAELHPASGTEIHIESNTDTTGGTASVWSIITLDREITDNAGTFASNKWTPGVVGKYFVWGCVRLQSSSQSTLADATSCAARIVQRDSGDAVVDGHIEHRMRLGGASNPVINVCGVLDYADATDYISLEAFASVTNWEADGSAQASLGGWRIS